VTVQCGLRTVSIRHFLPILPSDFKSKIERTFLFKMATSIHTFVGEMSLVHSTKK